MSFWKTFFPAELDFALIKSGYGRMVPRYPRSYTLYLIRKAPYKNSYLILVALNLCPYTEKFLRWRFFYSGVTVSEFGSDAASTRVKVFTCITCSSMVLCTSSTDSVLHVVLSDGTE